MMIGAEKLPAGLRKGNADDWFTLGRFSLLLGLLIAGLNFDVLLGTQTFYFRDFGFFGYPLAYYHKQSFWSGEVPLWNPLSNSGIPFMAQWNTLVFYPGSLIYLLLPLPWSLNLYCLFHLFLAGAFMYLLALHWTQNRLAASVAGMAYVFNGLSLNCLMWPNNIAALAWMPLVILTAERAWTLGGRHLVLAALVGATQMLSGAPEFIICTWGIAALIGIINFLQGKTSRLKMAFRAVSLAALIGGLAAVQLLPFLELLNQSQRGAGYGTDYSAMTGTGWANLVIPLFGKIPTNKGVYFQSGQIWITSYYLGIGTLALAIFASISEKAWRVRLLSGIAVLSLILALGESGFIYPFVKELFPQIGFMRYPIKLFIPCVVAIPLLAAFGIRRACSRDIQLPRIVFNTLGLTGLALFLLATGLIGFSFLYPTEGEKPMTTLTNGLSRLGFLAAILSLMLFLRHLKAGFPKTLGLLVLLAFALDGITHTPNMNPVVRSEALQPGMSTFKLMDPSPKHGQSRAMLSKAVYSILIYSRTEDHLGDYLVQRSGLFSNANLLEDVPKVDGFYSLKLEREAHIQKRILLRVQYVPKGFFDFLGISQIVIPAENLFEWKTRPNHQPFVTIGQKPVFADTRAILAGLVRPDFSPSETVYLDAEDRENITAERQPGARVLKQTVTPHRVEAEVRSPGPALMVVAQSHYAPWKAYVDGVPTPVRYANHAYQAIEVPGGSHQVLLKYEDRMFRTGAWISIVTFVVCALSLWRSRTLFAR